MILSREHSSLAARGDPQQELAHRGPGVGALRQFLSGIVIDSKVGTLQTVSEWRQRDTLWTDGSGTESGEVGRDVFGSHPVTGPEGAFTSGQHRGM